MIYLTLFGTTTEVTKHSPEGKAEFWVAKYSTVIGEPILIRLVCFRELKPDTKYFLVGSPRIFNSKYVELDVVNAWDTEGNCLLQNQALLTVAGNLGKDSQAVHTEAGSTFYRASLACQNTQLSKNPDGTWNRGTTWINVSTNNKLLGMQHKGDKLGGCGSLKVRYYDDQNSGNQRASLDASLNNVEPLGKKGGGAKSNNQSRPASTQPMNFDDLNTDAPPWGFDTPAPVSNEDFA